MIPVRLPHSARVTTPKRSRDTANVGSLDYQSEEAVVRLVPCFIQSRGGTRSVVDAGASYPVDGMMYFKSGDATVDDLVEVVTPTEMASFKYIITSVMPKFDIQGRFNHFQATLVRTNVS